MGSSDTAVFAIRPTAGGKSRPDVFDRMIAGHDLLRLLMARLLRSRDSGPDRRRLIDQLSDAVEAHGAAAEQSFYAALMARTEDQRPIRHAVYVHDEAALLIDALSDREMTGETWLVGVCRLAEHLEDHFREEEGKTIPLARTLLDGAQAARLGGKYEQARRQWIEDFGHGPVQLPGPTRWTTPAARSSWASGNQSSAGGVSKTRARKDAATPCAS